MKTKPNIIFILVDDLGWKDLSCYGSVFNETPNIDWLHQQGITFTDAYASCPVCSPSRASVMTGKYPARVGVTDYIDYHGLHPCKGRLIDAPYIKHLPLNEKSLATALKEGGYMTWHIGKWHLGTNEYFPDKHGFDVNIAGCEWGFLYGGEYFSPWGIKTLKDGPKGEFLTDRLTDEAINLIRTSNRDTPFFLNYWPYAVHTPMQCPKELEDKYIQKIKDRGLDQVKTFEEGETFPTERKKHLNITRRLIQSDPQYAGLLENLDMNIGRMVKVLEEEGILENTIIVFTSDNGGLSTADGSPTCNAPLSEGKGWMYDGGVRVPLIVYWPGIVKFGSTCQVPVTSPDFYPTFLACAGLPSMPEQHVDGVSLMPLLLGEKTLEREAIYWHYPHYGNQGGTPGASVRMGDYKLIEFFEDGHIELYNLQEDISESCNLAGSMPEMAEKMKNMLSEWLNNVQAKFPERNKEFTCT